MAQSGRHDEIGARTARTLVDPSEFITNANDDSRPKRAKSTRKKGVGGGDAAPEPSQSAPKSDAAEPTTGTPSPSFSVVAVGASAGGLEAFTQLLRALPVDTGMAFVLVQHLSPTRESALAEILARATAMRVTVVVDDIALEPNCVHVIPPDKNMIVEQGHLRLLPREASGPQHPIDQFFRSLAANQHHRAIGVVLSGTATDGTLGLEEIKAEGGITFAQDESAQQSGMPESAVSSGCVDFVMSPEDIAAEIARIAKHPVIAPQFASRGAHAARLGGAKDKEDLAPILDVLRTATGVDFSQYKVNTLLRRIGRRMVLQHKQGVDDYVAHIRASTAEVEALYQDILINVTSFFRDMEVFEALKQQVIPKLLANRSKHDPVRVWVVGCSTGEEAYSLAMILVEAMESFNGHVAAQVFASDLNASRIESARTGVYSKERLQDVSRERLRRFFVEHENGFRVSKTIRDMCVFSRHNVMTDPPFSRMDIVTCRNLLIYLEPSLQQRIIPVLHYALKPNGHLVLGASESIGRFTDLFAVEDDKHKIFAKKPGSGRVPYLPVSTGRTTMAFHGAESPTRATVSGVARSTASSETDAHKEADRLLASFAPPAVLVDETLEILQFRGNTEPYLVPAQGRASHALLKMAREGLLVALQALLHRAKKENVAVHEDGLRVSANGVMRQVDIEVLPIAGNAAHQRCFLVLFKDAAMEDGQPRGKKSLRKGKKASADSAPDPSKAHVARLERELASTREHLQALMEQYEAANEELQSSSEEAQSTNEELQSINEELETSKEEIQSSNEELTTVNDELHNRNAEMSQLNSDLTNLISSIQLAVVIVGRDLRIRRFSPMAQKLLSVIPSDVGRSITDIRMNLDTSGLDALLTECIDTITSREREVRGGDGRWYSLRIRPYLTIDGKIDGAVLSMIDIDAIRRSREYAESIVATMREPLLVLDEQLRVRSASRSFYNTFGVTPESTEGRFVDELGQAPWCTPELRRLLGDVVPQKSTIHDLVVECELEGRGSRSLLLNARTLFDPVEERRSILLSLEDITVRKRAEDAVRASETRYRRLFESASDGILILDAHTAKITDVNPSIVELLEYSRAELIGKELWEIGLFSDAEASKAAMRELQEMHSIRYEGLPLETKSRRHIDVEFVGNLDVDSAQPVIQCNIRDITVRKQLEEDLARRNEELAANDVAKNHFITVLSHELRSPLNILRLWAQLIQRPGCSEENLRKGLAIIERCSAAQAQLVEDLLDVHRISSGRVRLEFVDLDLAEILSSVVDSMAPEAMEKNITVDRQIEPTPMFMVGDPERLQQVLRNLLGNAIKFTAPRGEIRIVLRRMGRRAEVQIHDTGEGISADDLPHVFDRFRHADPLSNSSRGGLGLGLAIAKQLAELHDGTITASSPGKGKGSMFSVNLPLSARDGANARPVFSSASKAESSPSLHGILVLVVDDEFDAREAIRLVLEEAGARTLVAGSADEALVAIQRRKPDVILSDLGMPGRNGYDLMRTIRALPAEQGGRIPAIAFTAYAAEDDRDRALSAGFQQHLAKPVEPVKLIAAVAAVAGFAPRPRASSSDEPHAKS